MTTATITLNPGTGGANPLVDTVTTVDGVAAPAGASAQMVKVGFGVASDFKTISATNPLSVSLPANTALAQPDVNATGTISTTDIVVAAPAGAGALVTGASTAGSVVFSAITGGYTAWVAQITGLTSGTLYFEASADSTTGADGNWINVIGRQIGILNSLLTGNATGNGNWRGNVSGYKFFRLRSVGTLTGTPAIVIRMSAGVATVFLNGSIPAGTNSIGTVQQAALTKGTQGATGVSTQDLKDSGRVAVVINCYQAAGIITTEALFAAATFSMTRDGGTPTTGQQFTVTAGKRFRLQATLVGIKNTAAAAGTSKLVLRYAAAGGTITNTSPIAKIWDFGSNATVANAYIGPNLYEIPDGLELLSAATFGFTVLSSAITMLHTITLVGYEY